MIAADQGIVAEFIDAEAVSQLWQLAISELPKASEVVAASYPPLLHIPRQVPIFEDRSGWVHTVMGTWTTENLMDYLRGHPGSHLPREAVLPGMVCTFGLDGAFPGMLPSVSILAASGGQDVGFEGTGQALLGDDGTYFQALADWWLAEMDSADSDERGRDNAVTAARFAETWRDACTLDSASTLSAFEMEMRARRMGMVVGDAFTRSFAWSQVLIGAEAVRAFNGLVAWWAAAVLMPKPFRMGMLDRCLSSTGMCAVLLAADAAVANLARAAAQRTGIPQRFPFDGVAYACAEGEIPRGNTRLIDLVGPLHGVPVFVPIAGHPAALWEMVLAVRVEDFIGPSLFRIPPVLQIRARPKSGLVLLVRVGERMPEPASSGGLVEVYVLEAGTAYDDLGPGRPLASPKAAGLAARLWRALH